MRNGGRAEGSWRGKQGSRKKRGKKIYGGHLSKEADVEDDESRRGKKRRGDAPSGSEACLRRITLIALFFFSSISINISLCQALNTRSLQLGSDVPGSGRQLNTPTASHCLIYASGGRCSTLEYGVIAILNTAQPSAQLSSAAPAAWLLPEGGTKLLVNRSAEAGPAKILGLQPFPGSAANTLKMPKKRRSNYNVCIPLLKLPLRIKFVITSD